MLRSTSLLQPLLPVAFLFLFVPQGFALPINCAKAATPNEKTICSDPTLIQADARMDTLYNISLHFVAMGTRGNLQDQQPVWISEREACGTHKSCIRAAYKKRTPSSKPLSSALRPSALSKNLPKTQTNVIANQFHLAPAECHLDQSEAEWRDPCISPLFLSVPVPSPLYLNFNDIKL